jgi:regulatory protein
MTITNILKGKNGINFIFADGKYVFSLDAETTVSGGVCVGEQLSLDKLNTIKAEVHERKSFDEALKVLECRNYGKKELINKLSRKCGEVCAGRAAEKAEKLGLIDDEDYAENCARKMFAKNFSINKVRYELEKRGLEKKLVSDVMARVAPDEKKQILILLSKKYAGKFSDLKGKRRVLAALQRLGYGYSAAESAMRAYENEENL